MKIFKLLSAATLVAMMSIFTGCNKENFSQKNDGEVVMASISVNTDALTKATADNDGMGASVARCILQVRLGGEIYEETTVEGTTGHYQASIRLINGQKYDILAWVDGGEEYYSLDADGVVTRVSDTINDDAADAFFGTAELDLSTATETTVTIEAKRPFAQLNLITTDLKEDFQPETVGVEFKAPKTFDIINGTFGEPETFKASFDGLYKTFNDSKNTVVMAYVFAGAAEKTILDEIVLSAKFEGEAHRVLANIPVQQNYRTNAIGGLFTVGANVIVDVTPGWGDPEIDHIIWDGTIDPLQAPAADGFIHIANANELAGLAKAVNEGDTFSGKTIVLDTDLDLGNYPWTPIGGEKSFAGTFDGNGYKIQNLYVNTTADRAGLFGYTSSATIKNINIEHFEIIGHHFAGAIVAYDGNNNGTVDNCHVSDGVISSTPALIGGSYDNGDKVGGIAGQLYGGHTINGCSVENVSIRAYRDCGGIIGHPNGACTITNNSVKDVTIIKDLSHPYDGVKDTFHEIVGRGPETCDLTTNTYENVEFISGGFEKVSATEYKIHDVDGLLVFADMVNDGTTTFESSTVTLMSDIDLDGINWKPIGGLVSYPSVTFAGTFDGNGKTISNLTTSDFTPDHACAGFFGSTLGAVKNLTLKNVDITSSHYAGGIVAYSSSSVSVVENCHVDGGTITSAPEFINGGYDNGDKVGGIFGISAEGAPISNCSVKNVTIRGYRDLGGIAGRASGTLTNNVVENVTIIQDNTNGYKSSVTTFGEIEGAGVATLVGNTASNVVIKSVSTVSTQDALNAAVAAAPAGAEISIVAAGTYKIPNVPQNITVSGVDGVVFNCAGSGSIASIPNGATFENVTLDFGANANYHGFQHAGTINMNGCTLKGLFFSYGDMNFTDCHFIQETSEYNMWAYGLDLTFTNCVFDSCGKFLNVFNEGSTPYNVTCEGCTFNTTTVNKPALNIKATSGANPLHHEIVINNCSANFTMEASTSDSCVRGGALWQVDDINASVASTNKVTVDGVVVYDAK